MSILPPTFLSTATSHWNDYKWLPVVCKWVRHLIQHVIVMKAHTHGAAAPQIMRTDALPASSCSIIRVCAQVSPSAMHLSLQRVHPINSTRVSACNTIFACDERNFSYLHCTLWNMNNLIALVTILTYNSWINGICWGKKCFQFGSFSVGKTDYYQLQPLVVNTFIKSKLLCLNCKKSEIQTHIVFFFITLRLNVPRSGVYDAICCRPFSM